MKKIKYIEENGLTCSVEYFELAEIIKRLIFLYKNRKIEYINIKYKK